MRVRDTDLYESRRRAAGLSFQDLADRTKRSKTFMAYIAHGNVRLTEHDAALIAAALDSRVSELFAPAPDERRLEMFR